MEYVRRFATEAGEIAHYALMNRNKAKDRVYFIQDTAGKQIKIGWASNVDRRLAELQQGNPHRLGMLAFTEGSHRHEAALHRRFAHLRVFGEWFRPGEELIELIDALHNGAMLCPCCFAWGYVPIPESEGGE